jgi:hypothetical protein
MSRKNYFIPPMDSFFTKLHSLNRILLKNYSKSYQQKLKKLVILNMKSFLKIGQSIQTMIYLFFILILVKC